LPLVEVAAHLLAARYWIFIQQGQGCGEPVHDLVRGLGSRTGWDASRSRSAIVTAWASMSRRAFVMACERSPEARTLTRFAIRCSVRASRARPSLVSDR